MTIAIYTDASIVKGGRGAWATVIVREGCELVETSGALRGTFRSSTAVEGAAMANALWYARKRGLIEPGDRVSLLSDSQSIVQRIVAMVGGRAMRDAKDPAIMQAASYVVATAKNLDVEVAAKWVRGHQRLASLDPHALYNIRCDQLCRAIRDGHPVQPFGKLVKDVASHRQGAARKAARASLGGEGCPA